MSTYILTPNSTSGTTWSAFSGTVAGGNLADGSDSTGIRTVSGGAFYLNLSTVTVPANEVACRVSLSVRTRRTSGSGTGYAVVVDGSDAAGASASLLVGAAFATRVGGAGSRLLAQDRVDALRVLLATGLPTGSVLEMSEASVTLTTASLPQAPVIASPSGTITDSTRPVVEWTHKDRISVAVASFSRSGTTMTITTDTAHGFAAGQNVRHATSDVRADGAYVILTTPTSTTYTVQHTVSGTISSTAITGSVWIGDDKPQMGREVAIFTAAQYGVGGFDPATSAATWRAPLAGWAMSYVEPTVDLPNATYRVYVRTAVHVAGQTVWSPWTYSAFTIDITPEPAPDFAATWDETTNRVVLAVEGDSDDSGPLSGFEALVERSTDGETWTQVRTPGDATHGVVGIVLDGTQAVTVDDHEAPRGTVVHYRASIVATVPYTLAGATASDTVVTTLDGLAWVKSLDHPDLNRGYARLMVAGYSEAQDSGAEVFRDSSSGEAFVIQHPVTGWDRDVVVECWTAEDVAALKTVLGAGTLLLQFCGLYDLTEAQQVRGERTGQVRVRPIADPRRPRRLTWEVSFALTETAP